jgi:hypothetical protein
LPLPPVVNKPDDGEDKPDNDYRQPDGDFPPHCLRLLFPSFLEHRCDDVFLAEADVLPHHHEFILHPPPPASVIDDRQFLRLKRPTSFAILDGIFVTFPKDKSAVGQSSN